MYEFCLLDDLFLLRPSSYCCNHTTRAGSKQIWRIFSGINQRQSALKFYKIYKEAIIDSHPHPLNLRIKPDNPTSLTLHCAYFGATSRGWGSWTSPSLVFNLVAWLSSMRSSVLRTIHTRALRSRPWEEAAPQFLIWSMDPESCLPVPIWTNFDWIVQI